MTYRILCTYHPEVGTFRGKRGAWRVHDGWKLPATWPDTVRPVYSFDAGRDGRILCINSIKPRQRNSWCNPRSILAEWLEARH